jgi:hypothetical protein
MKRKLSHESLSQKIGRKILLKPLLGSITLGLMTSLISCSSAPNSSSSNPTPPPIASSPSPSSNSSPFFKSNPPLSQSPSPESPQNPSPDANNQAKYPDLSKAPKASSPDSKDTVLVNIYQADRQCNDFVAESIALPHSNSLELAVAKVIEKTNLNEFNLAGYKVINNPQTGIATIDFQVASNSKRKFTSLSTCEQFNLFGSLRKTLIDYPGWQIKDVRFTEQGKEIIL